MKITYANPDRYGEPAGATRVPFVELVAPTTFLADGIIAGIGGFANAIPTVAGRIKRARQIRRTVNALYALDDDTLKDIGVKRCEIRAVARHTVEHTQGSTPRG